MEVFHAEVVRTEDLSPVMRRVVLGGPGLAAFGSTGVGDEYVRVQFPTEPDEVPDLPRIVDGALDHASVDLGRLRTYTVRAFDAAAGELTLDIVIHRGGVGSSWALRARPGQVVALTSPTALHTPPPGQEWQVLVADTTGLPAAARLLEGIPSHVRVRVVVEVANTTTQRIALPEHPRAEVTWVQGGNGTGPSRVQQVVGSLELPAGVGHVWVAGESREVRHVRDHLRRVRGLPPGAYQTTGYWRWRAEEWYARFQALDDADRQIIHALWDDTSRDPEEVADEYHRQMTRLGL